MIPLPHHLRHVRSLPCVLCGSREHVHAHHVRLTGTCGVSTKPPDHQTVPLCWRCHERAHRGLTGEDRAKVLEALGMLQSELLEMVLSGEVGF